MKLIWKSGVSAKIKAGQKITGISINYERPDSFVPDFEDFEYLESAAGQLWLKNHLLPALSGEGEENGSE